MKALLVALGGFVVATVLVIAVAQTAGPTSNGVPAAAGGNMPATMASGGMMGGSGATARDIKLSILHVQRGCHVWRDGRQQGPMMRLMLQRGGRLAIVDQDLDAHQLLQVAGPRLHMPGPMTMMGRVQLRFMKPGKYQLATKTVDVPGNPMPDAKTIGPDNHLRLTVTVT